MRSKREFEDGRNGNVKNKPEDEKKWEI
jgi:hypothetical protein